MRVRVFVFFVCSGRPKWNCEGNYDMAVCFKLPWLPEVSTGLICKYILCDFNRIRNDHCLWRAQTTNVNRTTKCNISKTPYHTPNNRLFAGLVPHSAVPTGNESQIENGFHFTLITVHQFTHLMPTSVSISCDWIISHFSQHITSQPHHSHSAGRWMNITCVSTAPFNRKYEGINSKYGSLHITFCMEFHRLIMHCIDTLNCNIEITSSHSNKLFLVKIALIRPLELWIWNIQ